MKELLFVAGVHGDEKIGILALENLQKEVKIDWLVANRKAERANKRFIDLDLNRVAPGNPNGKEYETRKAYEILEKAKNYKIVIDIHGTTANSGIFAIVTNPKPQNLYIASVLPVQNVVIWVAKNKEKMNPLSEFFNCGLELECGPKNSTAVQSELEKILESIVSGDYHNDMNKRYFMVYDRMDGTKTIKGKEFDEIDIEGEKFYPLLINQYEGIVCYKMKKVDWIEVFSY